jgi:hypothetical protein
LNNHHLSSRSRHCTSTRHVNEVIERGQAPS